jgi:hypothetical protein
MKSHLNTPLHKGPYKDKSFIRQMQKVFVAFHKQPKTMLMVSIETGILRANICRYVAKWKKENRICMVRKGICPISKHRAGFYTTNPELFLSIACNEQSRIVEPSNTVKL